MGLKINRKNIKQQLTKGFTMLKDRAKISKCGRRKAVVVRVWWWFLLPRHYAIYTFKRKKRQKSYVWLCVWPMTANTHRKALALRDGWLDRGFIEKSKIQQVFNELTEGAV